MEESIKNPNRATQHFPAAIFQVFIEKIDHLTNNSGSISQSVSGGNVDSLQASHGNNTNQVTENSVVQTFSENLISPADVIRLLSEIEQMLHPAELPADTKEEATTYLKAAKKAVEKEDPKKELAATTLKAFAETLENASKSTESAKKIWENIKLILEQLTVWLGVAATFFNS